jgi:hypothetical protein
VIEKFAKIYLDNNTELKPLIRAILLSDDMYTAHAMWGRTKSPVDSVMIAARQLGLTADVSRIASATVNVQGQTPFNPPDVSGWPDGMEWINSGTLLSRMNYANSIVAQFDPLSWTAGTTFANAGEIVDHFLRRLGPLTVSSDTRTRLVNYVAPNGTLPAGATYTSKLRGLAHLVLSLPEWQLN